MKKYISTSIIAAVLLTTSITGCKKEYLSQEVNPNNPSVSTPQLTLAAAEVGAANIISTNYNEYGVWSGYWTTSGNYVPNQGINQYQFTNQTFDTQTGGPWINLYSNLTNFNTLQNISTGSANAYFRAIAMIMKAYDFEQLVDSYNDVPYSQAFKPSTVLFPQYDKAADIYHDLGKQLDAAIALINSSAGAVNPGSSDVVFGGNMTGWKKFANSLKLRLAIHVSTVLGNSDPLVAGLAATAGEGYLDGTIEADCNPGYSKTLAGSGVSQQNPFWNSYGVDVNGNPASNEVYYRSNAFAIKFLKDNSDPRLSQFYAPITSATPAIVIQGNVFGDTSPALNPNPSCSSIGPGLAKSPSQNAILFSGAESLFLQAEAALKAYIPGDPQALYNAGVTASFVAVQAGGTYVAASPGSPQTPGFNYTPASAATSTALATTYLNSGLDNVTYAASSNKLKAIIMQKWVALNGINNLEAYNEYRRTGFPALPSSKDPAAISTTLPTRIFYPISELTSNATSLAKEGTIDPFTSKIFFAQ